MPRSTPALDAIVSAVPANWRELTHTTVPIAGLIIGSLSKNGSYDAAKRGEIPTIKLGRKLVVPVAPLRRLLGELPAATEVPAAS